MRFHIVPLVVLMACTQGGTSEEFVVDHADGSTRTTFSSGAIKVSSLTQPWQVDLAVVGFGRTDAIVKVDPISPRKSPTGGAIYDRPGFTEWYENRSDGMKQGFDVPTSPAGTGDLEIQMSVRAGLLPVMTQDGRSVNFLAKDGVVNLKYDALYVEDADGRELESWMELDCTRACVLSVVVDDADAVYPVYVDPRVWDPTAGTTIVSPNGGGNNDRFGSAIAMDGTRAVVGAIDHDPHSTSNSGRAFIFEQDGLGVWNPVATLTPSAADAVGNGNFGRAVALDGDTVIVGAPATGASLGAAFVFVRTGPTTWPREAKLVDPSPDAGDFYGLAVAVSGNTAMVGAPNDDSIASNRGAAYVYTRTGVTWSGATTLPRLGTHNASRYGSAIALDGSRAAIGAPNRNTNGAGSGSVTTLAESGGTWSVVQEFLGNDTANGHNFGFSVALDANNLIVGAPHPGGATTGAAYVFVETAGSWAQQAKLIPLSGTPAAGDEFGYSVDISGPGALVGARLQDQVSAPFTFTERGTAYVFDREGIVWSEEQILQPGTSPAASDAIGFAVAIDGDEILIGGPEVDLPNASAGQVYAYRGTETDADGDGATACLSLFPHTPTSCDCDDGNASIRPPVAGFPNITEISDNGVDENCDNFDAVCGTLQVTGCNPRVLVTEVLAQPGNGVDSDLGQWIELRNRSSHAIDLRGASVVTQLGIEVRETLIDRFVVLTPGQHAVIAASSNSIVNGGVVVDDDFDPGFQLFPADQQIEIRRFGDSAVGGVTLDTLILDDSFSTGTDYPEGASLNLDAFYAAAGTGILIPTQNDNPYRWCDGRSAFGDGQLGTPGAINDDCSYTIPFIFTYDRVMGADLVGNTTVTFAFDPAGLGAGGDTGPGGRARWFTTGNLGEGSFTRSTSDALGGQELLFEYEYANGTFGPVYDGLQPFGDDCIVGGDITNLSPAYVSGTWDATDCP